MHLTQLRKESVNLRIDQQKFSKEETESKGEKENRAPEVCATVSQGYWA